MAWCDVMWCDVVVVVALVVVFVSVVHALSMRCLLHGAQKRDVTSVTDSRKRYL